MKWVIGLVVVGVLGWFGFQYMNDKGGLEVPTVSAEAMKKAEEAAAAAKASAAQAVEKAQESMPAGLDLSKITDNLDGVVSSASESLSGITDVESAKAALPSLEDASGKLSGLSSTIGRLPDAAKGPIAGIISGAMSTLQPVIDKVSAIPGVGPVIEPILTPMLETLEGMAG